MVSFGRKEVKSLQGLLYLVGLCLFVGNGGEVMKAHMNETYDDMVQADLFNAEPPHEPGRRALLGAPERREPMNYLRDSKAAVKVFKDCTADPNCHIRTTMYPRQAVRRLKKICIPSLISPSRAPAVTDLS
jgi:hypothetical protein